MTCHSELQVKFRFFDQLSSFPISSLIYSAFPPPTDHFSMSDQSFNYMLTIQRFFSTFRLSFKLTLPCVCQLLLQRRSFIHSYSTYHVVIDGICTSLILTATSQALLFSSCKNFPIFQVLPLFIILGHMDHSISFYFKFQQPP